MDYLKEARKGKGKTCHRGVCIQRAEQRWWCRVCRRCPIRLLSPSPVGYRAHRRAIAVKMLLWKGCDFTLVRSGSSQRLWLSCVVRHPPASMELELVESRQIWAWFGAAGRELGCASLPLHFLHIGLPEHDSFLPRCLESVWISPLTWVPTPPYQFLDDQQLC